jgi:hypothetical protein
MSDDISIRLLIKNINFPFPKIKEEKTTSIKIKWESNN